MQIISVEEQAITVELSPADAEALAKALETAKVSIGGLIPNFANLGLPEVATPESGEWYTRWELYQTSFEALAMAGLQPSRPRHGDLSDILDEE